MDKLNLPCYDTIDNLVLVGTNHALNVWDDTKKTALFLEELSKAEHLILEGYSGTYLKNKLGNNYENLAYAFKPNSVTFLEDGELFIEQRGTRRDLLGMYMVLHTLPFILAKAQTMQDVKNGLNLLVKNVAAAYLVDEKDTYYKVSAVLNKYSNLVKLNNLSRAWTNTSSRNRDTHIFGPKSKKLMAELKGSKFEVVGYNHFKFLQKYLRGIPCEIPNHWTDSLDDEHKSIAEDIESRMFPK